MRWLQKPKLLVCPELGLVAQLARRAHVQVGAVQTLCPLAKGVAGGPGGEGPELCQGCATNPASSAGDETVLKRLRSCGVASLPL